MLPSLPNVGLLAVLLLFWLERRLIGGRATLSFSRFREAFAVGCVGASVAALVLQRIVLQFVPLETAAWTWGPLIEEIAKVAPVVILVLFLGASRWLSIADLTLLGLASGLGFEFVETNLRILASSRPEVPALSVLFDTARDPRVEYIFSGHGTTAALTALGLAIGFRFWGTSRVGKWIPAVSAFAIGCFDHCMVNWKVLHTVYLFGQVQSVGQASQVAENVYVFTLHGALEAVLLLAGLTAASWWEGRSCARAIGSRSEFLLPGETRPLVAVEWMVALSRLKLGRLPFSQTLAYFRLRRSYAQAVAESSRYPEREQGVQWLARRLSEMRNRVVNPLPSDWVPPRGLWAASVRKWLKRSGGVLCSRLLIVLLFLLPALMPDPVARLTHTTGFAGAMIALSLALTLPGIRAFRRQPRLDPLRTEPDGLAARYHRGMLLGLALASSGAAIVNFLLGGKLLMAAQSAFISDAVRDWTNGGGNPGTLLGAAGLLTTEPEPPCPCEGLRNEVDKGDARIKEMQERLRNAGISPIEAGPYDDRMRPITNIGIMPPTFSSQGQAASRPGGQIFWQEITPETLSPGGSLPRFGAITNIGTMPGTLVPGSLPNEVHMAPPGGGKYEADRAALQAEMWAQGQRLIDLMECEKSAAVAPVAEKKEDKDKNPADIGALKAAAEEAKRKFEDMERQLRGMVDADLEGIQSFLHDYDEQWKVAMDYMQRYIGEYPGLLKDYKAILQQYKDRASALKMADQADEVLQVVEMLATEGLLDGLEQAKYLKSLNQAAESAKEARAAMSAERALEGVEAVAEAEPAGVLAAKTLRNVESAEAEEVSTARLPASETPARRLPASATPAPPTPPGREIVLQPGAEGNQQLSKVMEGFVPTQNKVYSGTINSMKQDMVNGTFDWSKADKPIQLDGNVIVDGHHRMIAAKMAAQETGRPLLGAANAIIPEGGVVNSSVGARQTTTWGSLEQGGIGVKAGDKPATAIPKLSEDPSHMQELRDIQAMSGPEEFE